MQRTGGGVRMFDRAVMYKFTLDSAGLLAVIGAHSRSLRSQRARQVPLRFCGLLNLRNLDENWI